MSNSVADADRRRNPQLRTIFVEVYEVLLPFFDPASSWSGQPQVHLAYRALHEQFPGLSAQEISVLVSAARRVFNTHGKPAAP